MKNMFNKKILEQYNIFSLLLYSHWLQLLVLVILASLLYLPSLYNLSQHLAEQTILQQQLEQLKHKVSQNLQISVAVKRQKEQIIAKQSGLVALPLKRDLIKLLDKHQIDDFSLDFNFNQGLTAELSCSTSFMVFQGFFSDLLQQKPNLEFLDIRLTPQVEQQNIAINLSFYP